jgi:hypothetical protein
MTADDPGRAEFRRGLWWGLGVGLLVGVPAGVALKAAGYPSDELYAWWTSLGVAYVLVLIAAALLAVRRVRLAGGLAIGATVAMAFAPFLVVADIVSHSA